MNNQRAIDILYAETLNNQQPLHCTRKELCDAVGMAESALCAEPNEPLTLDELRQMDGEPVYIFGEHADYSGWAIPRRNTAKYIAACSDNKNISYYPKGYGKTWLAYRHKPEQEAKL